jgi:hypothetical protein
MVFSASRVSGRLTLIHLLNTFVKEKMMPGMFWLKSGADFQSLP